MILPDDIEWRVEQSPVAYPAAMAMMSARAASVAAGKARELVWLLEHPPLYTAGTSADPAELLDPRFPVFAAGRGGRYTYHGPGQRIGYLVLDLRKRGRDVRSFIHALEAWLIATLAQLDIEAFRAPGRVGIWTFDEEREAKIGAIGVRISRWVTMHGFSINIMPDLRHFNGIIPCGLPDFTVTSVQKLGRNADFATFDSALAVGFAAFLDALAGLRQNEA